MNQVPRHMAKWTWVTVSIQNLKGSVKKLRQLRSTTKLQVKESHFGMVKDGG